VGGSVTMASANRDVQVLYDSRGNISYKSDVGQYWYDAARPNRMTNITLSQPAGAKALTGTRILSYAFDDYRAGAQTLNGTTVGNGNLWYSVDQDSATGRHTVRWETYTSFNMPKEILYGSLVDSTRPVSTTVAARTLTFAYGPEHQRVRQVAQVAAGQPTNLIAGSTWYLNGEDSLSLTYEKFVPTSGPTEHRHYLGVPGLTAALFTTRSSGTSTTATLRYFHHDHLGSIAAISNEAGTVVERLAYDPWGKRRYANGLPDSQDVLTGENTERGYTEHEHLDEMDAIHMNGRIYDPLIGRFMSADPTVPYPFDLRSFNRYSYARNNPLRFVDLTGFEDSDGDGDSESKPTPSGGYTHDESDPGTGGAPPPRQTPSGGSSSGGGNSSGGGSGSSSGGNTGGSGSSNEQTTQITQAPDGTINVVNAPVGSGQSQSPHGGRNASDNESQNRPPTQSPSTSDPKPPSARDALNVAQPPSHSNTPLGSAGPDESDYNHNQDSIRDRDQDDGKNSPDETVVVADLRSHPAEIALCIACLFGGNRVPPQLTPPPRPIPILPQPTIPKK
jgi:RHS repeat-associated protein